jgi:transcriptional regulator with XRE-family HTH domain
MPSRSHMEDAILFVLDRELILAGKTRADLARSLGVAKSTITRRMQGKGMGRRSPSEERAGLDAFVESVAEYVDQEPLWLWQEAIRLLEQGRTEEGWNALQMQREVLAERGPSPPPAPGEVPF